MTTTTKGKRMVAETRAVLLAAGALHDRLRAAEGTILEKDHAAWFRPKEVGGGRNNQVGRHLLSLVRRGFIERRDATKPGSWREQKLWEYRLTPAGLDEIRASSPEHRGGWYGSHCHGQ